ncbi:MAG TPA: hypothetical protein VGJ94_03280 [Syntrophorhabdaceae bacterium]|jgi:hypothetical protein
MIHPTLKKCILPGLLIAGFVLLLMPFFGEAKEGAAADGAAFAPMAGPGKKISMGSTHYLIYSFDRTPKLGMLITKIEIFTKEGKKDTSFELKGDAGMPSMKGAHETGDKTFSLSKRGDYLLPVNIVMPGDWEIRVTISKEGKVVMRGRVNFDV